MTRSIEPKEVCPICETSALFMVDRKINGEWVEVKACRDAFCSFNELSEMDKAEAFLVRGVIEFGDSVF